MAISVKAKFIVGLNAFEEKCGITPPMFYKLLSYGLPARKIDGRWYGHVDNVEEFLRRITLKGGPIDTGDSDEIKRKVGD